MINRVDRVFIPAEECICRGRKEAESRDHYLSSLMRPAGVGKIRDTSFFPSKYVLQCIYRLLGVAYVLVHGWDVKGRPIKKDKRGYWKATVNLGPGRSEYRFSWMVPGGMIQSLKTGVPILLVGKITSKSCPEEGTAFLFLC